MDNKWLLTFDKTTDKVESEKIESLMTLGNGYLGLRGDRSIAFRGDQLGTYINGFYEKGPITYGEKAYGFAQNWQTIVDLPDSRYLKINIDGQEILNNSGKFLYNRNILNMKNSSRLWEFSWIDEMGKIYKGTLHTIIPFQYKGLVLHKWEIDLPEKSVEIGIDSQLLFSLPKKNVSDDPRLAGHFNRNNLKFWNEQYDEDKKINFIETSGSFLLAASIQSHDFDNMDVQSTRHTEEKDQLGEIFFCKSEGKISFTKSVLYRYDSRENKRSLRDSLIGELKEIEDLGFESIVESQKFFMDRFWDNSDVIIKGDDEAQLSIRYNLFQLLQSTGSDGKRSVAAKGLSGPGYEGHYFWDAETYVFPFFLYTNRLIAKSLLLYRISTLNEARKRASLLGHKGVLFPWRTINGEESSAYFPAGTAQYHINGDIAIALSTYLEITGDLEILQLGGAELLSETARFWIDLGAYIEGKGFCFNEVTGPDEYTALVNNNFYTNICAKKNLIEAAHWLKNFIHCDELENWKKISSQIYLPQSGKLTPQDDQFLENELWNFKNTTYPLLLHYHPLNIYRKQVLKQADVILAQALFPSILPEATMKINFDYYESITTRDSSLSACAQGIVAHKLAYDNLAWEYFLETIHTDRSDIHDNVRYGLHTASMGGSYLMILSGFLGLECSAGKIIFKPKLPTNLKEISLKLFLKNSQMVIRLNQKEICYEVLDENLLFYHFNQKIDAKKNKKMNFALPYESIDSQEFYRTKDFKGFRPKK